LKLLRGRIAQLYRFALALSAGGSKEKTQPGGRPDQLPLFVNCHYVDHRNSRHGPASVHEIALGELPAPVPGMSGTIGSAVGWRYAHTWTSVACPEYGAFRKSGKGVLEKVRIGGIVRVDNPALGLAFDASIGSPYIRNILRHFSLLFLSGFTAPLRDGSRPFIR